MEAPAANEGRKKIKKIIFDDDEEEDDDIMDETVEVVTAYDSEGDHSMAMAMAIPGSGGNVHMTIAGKGPLPGARLPRSSESVLDDSSSDSDGDLSSDSDSDDRSDSESAKEDASDYHLVTAAAPQKGPPPPRRQQPPLQHQQLPDEEEEDFQEPLEDEDEPSADDDDYDEDDDDEEPIIRKKRRTAPPAPAAAAVPRSTQRASASSSSSSRSASRSAVDMKSIQLGLRERRRVNYAEEEVNEDSDSDFGAEEDEAGEDEEDEEDEDRGRLAIAAKTTPAPRGHGAFPSTATASRARGNTPAKASTTSRASKSDEIIPTRFSARQERRTQVNYAESEGEAEEDEEDGGGMSDEDDEEGGHRKEGVAKSLFEEPKQVIDKILCHKEVTEDDQTVTKYLVKWKGQSFLHVEWLFESDILAERFGKTKLARYYRHPPLVYDEEKPFNPDFVQVDRILDETVETDEDGNEVTKYLVKWESTPYNESTWELATDINDDEKIAQFKRTNQLPPASKGLPERPDAEEWQEYSESPEFKDGNRLRAYQLEGLNWLVFNWYQRRNSILADEMGLGKTVQSISTMWHLFTVEKIRGPFLVIAPLSTIGHWKREVENWTDMNVIVYHGSSAAREVIRKYEWSYLDAKGRAIPGLFKWNVLVTTYEMVLADSALLKTIDWRYTVIDEAHRLKNKNSKLLIELQTYNFSDILLLTGTPLQNNTEELWSLLNFLDPEKFHSSEDFMTDFGDLKQMHQVQGLHDLLKPHLLRRMKEHVEKSIAPKEETIVEVELTVTQKKYYKAIYEKNTAFLTKGCSGGNVPNMLNIMMQLRKCCNHPYLINGVESQILNGLSDPESIYQMLIKSSGKLVLIDKLLPKLISGGHKVLIFSQMVRVLDILEDYLNFRKYTYERIDGGVRGNDRQAAIDRFCKKGSDRNVFLLCTRAGGVGINLTAADTVIIFDSDWNPQNDIQAQARCHRIGQTQMVKVYRLITRGTYERHMFERASLKLGLDQAVLGKMAENREDEKAGGEEKKLDKKEIDALLKYGAYDVFREGQEEGEQYYEEDIDKILERSSFTLKPESQGGEPGGALSAFSKASFCSASSAPDVDLDDPDFWKKILPEAAQNVPDPSIQTGSRVRRKVKRFGQKGGGGVSDDEGENEDDGAYSEPEDGSGGGGGKAGGKKVKGREWSNAERSRFKSAIFNFGYGRWNEIKTMGKLTRRTQIEVEGYARALLHMIYNYAKEEDSDIGTEEEVLKKITNVSVTPPSITPENGGVPAAPATSTEGSGSADKDETGKAKEGESEKETNGATADKEAASVTPPAPTPQPAEAAPVPISDDQWRGLLEDTTLADDDKFIEYLKRNAQKLLKALEDLAKLGQLIKSNEASVEQLQKHVPTLSRGVMPDWWSKREDACFLLGVYKHGMGHYDDIKTDPALCFHERFQEAAALAASGAGDDDGEGGFDVYSGRRRSASRRGKRPQVVEWPQTKTLNLRLKNLLRALELSFRKKRPVLVVDKSGKESSSSSSPGAPTFQLQHPKDEDAQQRKPVKEWSKREKQDFYRALITHGVPYDQEGEYDWKVMQRNANLSRKTPAMIEKHYVELLERCRSTIRLFKKMESTKSGKAGAAGSRKRPEDEVILREDGDEMTYSQAMKVLQRIILFSKIRGKALKLGDEELRFRLKNLRLFTGLPKWWQVMTHDIALLKGIDKHGYGRWEEVCSDPDLPFFAIAQSMRERVESERKGENEANASGEGKKVKQEGREEGEISDDNMDEDEDRNEEDHENEDGNGAAADDNANGEDGGKKSTKRKRGDGGLLNRQVIDFPRETVLAKRLDYILKVALSAQIPDFVKREATSSSASSSSSTTTTTTTSSSSSSRSSADSRKQQSLDRFVKKEPTSSGKEKEKKRKRTSDHDDDEEETAKNGNSSGSKPSSSSSSAPVQARKKVKRSPSPPPVRDSAKERREHHSKEKVKEKERERDEEKDSSSKAAAGAKGKKKVAKGGNDKTPRTKKIVDLPTDENGQVKMPIKIAGLTVLSLGTIPKDRPEFHQKRYIWPVGFKSMRQYSSFEDPSVRCNYVSEILDGLQTSQKFNGPLFKVSPEDDDDEAIVEKSATAAWSAVIAKVNNMKTEETGKRQFTSVSGPEYFGFGVPAIAKLIQELPHADNCTKYEVQHYSSSGSAPSPSSSSSSTSSSSSSSKRERERERESTLPSFKSRGSSGDGDGGGAKPRFVLPKKKRVIESSAGEPKRRSSSTAAVANGDGDDDRDSRASISPRDRDRAVSGGSGRSRDRDRDRERSDRDSGRDGRDRGGRDRSDRDGRDRYGSSSHSRSSHHSSSSSSSPSSSRVQHRTSPTSSSSSRGSFS